MLYLRTRFGRMSKNTMEKVKIIEIKKSVFEDNDRAADALRGELKKKGVFLLNLMSSPGSGKTTTLIQTINLLKDKIRIAVMEADIDSDVDAIKIKEATGVESIQLHTGGMCHLDAEMTEQGLAHLTPTLSQGEGASPLREEGREVFDLILVVYSAGGLDVFDFAAESKRLLPDCPIVLLSAFSKEIYNRIEQHNRSDIDYFFNWNNSTDLIIAIIKLIEDRMNAPHDILEEGVRAILLVEDSVRYYSTYLPLLYKLVLQQNQIAIRDTLCRRLPLQGCLPQWPAQRQGHRGRQGRQAI